MATYKEIKGVTIQTLDSDPVVGGVAGGSWSSGGNMNEGRVAGAGSGTQTASIFAGGTPPTTADVELYNGSSWTETTEMNTARAELAAATVAPSTAALIFAGHTGTYPTQNASDANEYWNGSSWTELAEVNTGRWATAGAGASYTAALLYGGYNGSDVNNTETWNGSAWTEVNNLNTTRRYLAGTGSNTAAIAIGGSPGLNAVEQWDGSNWTATTNFPTGSEYIEAAGASYTDCLALGVTPSSTGVETIHWDGSSWTEVANYTTGRINGVGTGSSPAALLSGGNPAPVNASTEEFSVAPVTSAILTEGSIFLSGGTTLKGFGKAAGIPATVWSSGGNLNTARHAGGSAGIQTAALCSGGGNPSAVAVTEQYNGSAWTEVNDLNSGRKTSWNGLGLSYSAAIFSSGSQPPGTTRVANNESWNGSTWTEVNNVNTARNNAASSGSQTSGIGSGGYPAPSYTNATETWDGTSWTETSDLNTSRYVSTGAGQSSSSALNIGGYSSTYLAVVEQWDGSAWTEVSDLNTARYSGASSIAGPIDQVLFFGGDSSNPTPTETRTELWNGSSWTELNDLSTARWELYGAGTGGASALAYGGSPGPSAATEEWTSDNGLADISFD